MDHLIAIMTLLIIAFFAVRGYRKGFLGLIYGIFTLIFMMLFVLIGAPIIEEGLMSSTVYDAVYDRVEEKVHEKVYEKIQIPDPGAGTGLLPSVVDNDTDQTAISMDDVKSFIENQTGMSFDEASEAVQKETGLNIEEGQKAIEDGSALQEAQQAIEEGTGAAAEDIEKALGNMDVSDVEELINGLGGLFNEQSSGGNTEEGGEESVEKSADMIENLAELIEEAKESVHEAVTGEINEAISLVADELTKRIIHIMSVVIAIILSFMICAFVRMILEWVHEMPVMGQLGDVLGLAWGILEGIVIVWVIFAIFAAFGDSETGMSAFKEINESSALLWLYQHNPILAILTKGKVM